MPFKVPKTMTGAVRLIAPLGFIWNFQNQDFKHTTKNFAGINADFPGGYPATRDHCVLTFNSATYVAGKSYGFSALVEVPDRSPALSSNSFFVELGYDSSNP